MIIPFSLLAGHEAQRRGQLTLAVDMLTDGNADWQGSQQTKTTSSQASCPAVMLVMQDTAATMQAGHFHTPVTVQPCYTD